MSFNCTFTRLTVLAQVITIWPFFRVAAVWPSSYAPVAQGIERLVADQEAAGPIPAGRTTVFFKILLD